MKKGNNTMMIWFLATELYCSLLYSTLLCCCCCCCYDFSVAASVFLAVVVGAFAVVVYVIFIHIHIHIWAFPGIFGVHINYETGIIKRCAKRIRRNGKKPIQALSKSDNSLLICEKSRRHRMLCVRVLVCVRLLAMLHILLILRVSSVKKKN